MPDERDRRAQGDGTHRDSQPSATMVTRWRVDFIPLFLDNDHASRLPGRRSRCKRDHRCRTTSAERQLCASVPHHVIETRQGERIGPGSDFEAGEKAVFHEENQAANDVTALIGDARRRIDWARGSGSGQVSCIIVIDEVDRSATALAARDNPRHRQLSPQGLKSVTRRSQNPADQRSFEVIDRATFHSARMPAPALRSKCDRRCRTTTADGQIGATPARPAARGSPVAFPLAVGPLRHRA